MYIEKQNELVLVFKKELMYGFTGLLTDQYPKSLEMFGLTKNSTDLDWFQHCVKHSFFLPRGLAETNPEYKQIIPYIALKNGDRYFTYSRDGAETRLKGSLSVGVGGHINPVDLGADIATIVREAARREFAEEVSLPKSYSSALLLMGDLGIVPKALLYAGGKDSSMVNMVHLGAVYVVNVSDDHAQATDLKEEGKKLGWISEKELWDCWSELETWSQIAVHACL